MDMLSTPRARFTFAPPTLAPVSRPKRTVFLVHSSLRAHSPVRTALQENGYHVIYAESVEAALRVWTELTVGVDLFLADISLGKDQGVERLVKLLQAENPRLRVLYANDLEEGAGLISAQSYPQQLVAVVENCLC